MIGYIYHKPIEKVTEQVTDVLEDEQEIADEICRHRATLEQSTPALDEYFERSLRECRLNIEKASEALIKKVWQVTSEKHGVDRNTPSAIKNITKVQAFLRDFERQRDNLTNQVLVDSNLKATLYTVAKKAIDKAMDYDIRNVQANLDKALLLKASYPFEVGQIWHGIFQKKYTRELVVGVKFRIKKTYASCKNVVAVALESRPKQNIEAGDEVKFKAHYNSTWRHEGYHGNTYLEAKEK